MHDKDQPGRTSHAPLGFTPGSGGSSSEYAREMGWGTNEQERTKTPTEKQNYDGGRDYGYGARDFGDSTVDTSKAGSPRNKHPRPKKNAA